MAAWCHALTRCPTRLKTVRDGDGRLTLYRHKFYKNGIGKRTSHLLDVFELSRDNMSDRLKECYFVGAIEGIK